MFADFTTNAVRRIQSCAMGSSRFLLLAVLAISGRDAGATMLTVANPGFENAILDVGQFNGAVDGWTKSNTITSGTGLAGVLRPGTAQFTNLVPEGNNLLFIRNGSATIAPAIISQVLADSLQANTGYNLSVMVGQRKDNAANAGYQIQLLAGGVLLAEDVNSTALIQDQFVPISVNFSTGAEHPQLGGLLEIRLTVTDVGGVSRQTCFDAIELSATPITLTPGDFDGDGDVDGADFVAWQTNFPKASDATLADGDADGDNDVDGADFDTWQTSFPAMGGGATTVPEPLSFVLIAIGVTALCWHRRGGV